MAAAHMRAQAALAPCSTSTSPDTVRNVEQQLGVIICAAAQRWRIEVQALVPRFEDALASALSVLIQTSDLHGKTLALIQHAFARQSRDIACPAELVACAQ